MTSPSPRRDPNPDARWLCSHLVRLNFPGDQSLSETGLLEEIEPTRAWVAVEAAYPLGSRVNLAADDFDVSAEVVRCRAKLRGHGRPGLGRLDLVEDGCDPVQEHAPDFGRNGDPCA